MMSANAKSGKTTPAKADLHDVVMPLLIAMYAEFKEFSKKKPDGVLSSSKVKMVNRLLEECCKVLDSEVSFQFLDLLDEDNLPQNSDVVLILSQYVAAMEAFKSKYFWYDSLLSTKCWHTS